MTHDHTPKLPDIFPQDRIKVDEEPHRYETFEGDSGSVLEKDEYILDKAPVDSITDVTGIVDGQAVTFTQGTDYSLQDLVRNQQNDFTFFEDDGPYTLDDAPDAGSTVVTDDSGDSYTENTDYEIFNPDDIEADTLRWLDGGSSPDDEEDFTVKFTVTFNDSIIKWDTAERTPDAGSIFYVTYRCESVISRYIEGAEEQLNSVEDELNAIIKGKFVDSAEGQELDEIGKVFGVLGKRNGRDDTQYRIFLKSVVQSFVSRGTVNGIKLAISAATDVPIDDITIREDFQDNEYEVVVIPNNPVDGSLLEQVAEIADPSGVRQSGTRFTLDDEITGIADAVSFTEGQQIADAMSVDDAATAFNSDTFEQIVADDASAVDPNKTTTADDAGVTDANAVDPNKTTAPGEDVSVDDTIEKVDEDSAHAQYWEFDQDPNTTTEWNFFQWTELLELARSTADDVGSADATAIDPNVTTTTDSAFSNDANAIDANLTTVGDDASADDAVTVTFNQTLVAEDTGAGDGNAFTTASVAWGSNWESFNWGGAVETAFE